MPDPGTLERYSDEQLYALALYVYSLQPPLLIIISTRPRTCSCKLPKCARQGPDSGSARLPTKFSSDCRRCQNMEQHLRHAYLPFVAKTARSTRCLTAWCGQTATGSGFTVSANAVASKRSVFRFRTELCGVASSPGVGKIPRSIERRIKGGYHLN